MTMLCDKIEKKNPRNLIPSATVSSNILTESRNCSYAQDIQSERVDTKKKELIGNFYQSGRTWKKEAELVNSHDFPQEAIAKAIPYGIYDLAHNQGYIYVGTSADTSEFAVDAINWWWQHPNRTRFQREDKLLILCDAGGSNDYRRRLWKRQIQSVLADSLGLEVMVCHYQAWRI